MMADFGLQGHVDFLYDMKPRRLPFQAQTGDTFALWQGELRAAVRSLLGISGRVLPAEPAALLLEAVDRGAYIEEKYALEVGEGVRAPMYVLVPKTPPPYKPVMAFHGHVPSIQYLLGQYPDEVIAAERLAVDENYAQRLAEDGYLVCAVEQRGFGERITGQAVNDVNSCRHLAFAYLMQGRTLLGARVWDGMVAISHVLHRADVVPGVLGCTGHSGGGTTALWLSALDERVTVAVVQSYFCSFKDSILGMRHCECNYVPGILEYGEMGDLAALIAPRPLAVVTGANDPIFPIEGTRAQFGTVQAAYGLHGVGERCMLVVHDGAHVYDYAATQAWLAQWLAV